MVPAQQRGTLDMRNAPVTFVDPTTMPTQDRQRIEEAAQDVARTSKLDLEELPEELRDQITSTLQALAQGEAVYTINANKPLTSNEAAKALGMSRTLLTRLCEEGRIESFKVGNALRVHGEEVARILNERSHATIEGREAAASAESRRRDRAARAAGLD